MLPTRVLFQQGGKHATRDFKTTLRKVYTAFNREQNHKSPPKLTIKESLSKLSSEKSLATQLYPEKARTYDADYNTFQKDQLLDKLSCFELIKKYYPSMLEPLTNSNVLYYHSIDPYLTKQDFFTMLGSNLIKSDNTVDSRNFKLKYKFEDFYLVKARDPATLEFNNGYYLIFNDVLLSSCFFADTIGEYFFGMPINFKFITLDDLNELPTDLTSKLFDEIPEILTVPRYNKDFKVLQKKQNLEEIQQSLDSQLSNFTTEEKLFVKQQFTQTIKPVKRNQCAIVHNLPYNLSVPNLINSIFWEYDLYPDYSSCFELLLDDPDCHYKKYLVKFANKEEVERFFRNFNDKFLQGNKNFRKVYVDIVEDF